MSFGFSVRGFGGLGLYGFGVWGLRGFGVLLDLGIPLYALKNGFRALGL